MKIELSDIFIYCYTRGSFGYERISSAQITYENLLAVPLNIRLSGFGASVTGASITIVNIRTFYKMYQFIVRLRFIFRIANKGSIGPNSPATFFTTNGSKMLKNQFSITTVYTIKLGTTTSTKVQKRVSGRVAYTVFVK